MSESNQYNNENRDAQGRWYKLLSPTQVLTGPVPNNVQTTRKEHKKRTSHGNRKAQHKTRRRQRQRQEPIDQTIIEDDQLNSEHRTTTENKRKRQVNTDEINISQSLSQLSISQRNPKKTKSTSQNNLSEQNDLQQRFKPRYLRVSDKILKQMLSNTTEDNLDIGKCLDTTEKVQLVRQVIEATNNLYYYDLQRQLWQEYYNIGTKEDVWRRKITKSAAKQHRTCRSYGLPKHIVEERQKAITRQIQHGINELQKYAIQLQNDLQQWQPSVDLNILSTAINKLVMSAQRRLRQEFDYKTRMLVFNSNDHHLITKFYNLRPDEEQIYITKKIWQTIADLLKTKGQEEILRKRIYLRRLPNKFDRLIDQSLDYIEPMLMNDVLDKDRRASLSSRYSKTITQYKFELMTLNLDTIQAVIRGHQQLLDDLQSQLFTTCNSSLIQTIQDRAEAIKQQHEFHLKHQLDTFFDEAPTTSNE
ncbi:unnamed protein product [Rotaria socialis]|uniref:Uncharacterized protein n=5 Tax=Rotaria socialis TaxID=392032 RepID=A0A817U8I2_9BILA|nr:unnamed protein product [Rotaria socialis]CAF3472924.1 unnamed protein product [Rotaria socialis]CAF4494994.1 unnamed protein product [Rotaria socialis]CAF4617016.1 unnamed protein product [Rotaria socialis]